MKATNDIQAIAKNLCHDLVAEVAERHGRAFIVTNFTYPDGDSLNLYVGNGHAKVSDLGTTRHKLTSGGVRITASREKFIEQVCNSYGIKSRDGAFIASIDPERPGPGCLSLCEAITRISTLECGIEEHRESVFQQQLENVLIARVLPVRAWSKKWHDPDVDPKKAFPVDYHFNGNGSPRHLFRVSSPYKAAVVAAVANLYQARGEHIPTMSVVDPDANLGEMHINRLAMASDELAIGIDADRIVEFVTASE